MSLRLSSRLRTRLHAGAVVGLVLLATAGRAQLAPKVGRGTPPPNARGTGPWATRVMLAESTNGLDFDRLHFVLSDQAGVPNVVVDHEDLARVYYIDFGNGN